MDKDNRFVELTAYLNTHANDSPINRRDALVLFVAYYHLKCCRFTFKSVFNFPKMNEMLTMIVALTYNMSGLKCSFDADY